MNIRVAAFALTFVMLEIIKVYDLRSRSIFYLFIWSKCFIQIIKFKSINKRISNCNRRLATTDFRFFTKSVFWDHFYNHSSSWINWINSMSSNEKEIKRYLEQSFL